MGSGTCTKKQNVNTNNVKVTGSVTLDGYTKATFGTAEKNAFGAAMAKLAGVQASDVTVAVEDARRHLLAGVKVTYEIKSADEATAKTLQAKIKSKPATLVIQEMKSAGLDKVTTAAVTVDDEITYQNTNTETSTWSSASTVSSVFAVFIGTLYALLFVS